MMVAFNYDNNAGHQALPYTPRPSVNPIQSVKLFFKNYAVFNGRASRSEYWWVQLVLFVVSSLISIPEVMNSVKNVQCVLNAGENTQAVLACNEAAAAISLTVFTIISWLFSAAVFVPSIAVAVRRLHDTGRSGWFVLLGLIPVVGLALLVLLALPSKPEGMRYDTGKLPYSS